MPRCADESHLLTAVYLYLCENAKGQVAREPGYVRVHYGSRIWFRLDVKGCVCIMTKYVGYGHPIYRGEVSIDLQLPESLGKIIEHVNNVPDPTNGSSNSD